MESREIKFRIKKEGEKTVGYEVTFIDGKEDPQDKGREFEVKEWDEEIRNDRPAQLEPGDYDRSLFSDIIYGAPLGGINDPTYRSKAKPAKLYTPPARM